ncbi:hypothetical protein E5Q_03852 [Mixia osmundae IAM 14324]|uniref:Very-long-chain (3R)-3-hydroxyacyl-CoA dehydratase n=1 Tax=Mixia osmundae (strain CBS 9802 / IAM 14324 / JCM 22182 / KY 12970) TaxID=764103 RepID=G7E2Z5_MIXOS|nr:hypothetical protein E5Q_03852 [Mixia osmundae IAM 14324]
MAKPQNGLVKAYLITYNTLSCAAWAYILFSLGLHLATPPTSGSWLSRHVGGILDGNVPAGWAYDLIERSSTSYDSIGDLVRIVQTFAILEPIHILLGWVRSGLPTTMLQVISRETMVWLVCHTLLEDQVEAPAHTGMVLAWSITEVVRYTTYATSLLGFKIAALEWLRYSMFYVLYPLGAVTEMGLMYEALPVIEERYGKTAQMGSIVLMMYWPLGLVRMMTYMGQQRSKYLNADRTKTT